MRSTFLTLLFSGVLAISSAFAQDKYFTKNGQVSFFSSTPMENIEASNNNATSVIDAKTGKMEFAILMKAFKFEKALMEEHFNENYVESGKYPKATFAGNITNLSGVDFSKNGTYKVNVKGKMTIHGVTKDVEAPGTITVENGKVKANSVFNVAPEDYKIEIPKLVREKIAKEIKVTVNMDYQALKS
ncbi:YceI family protein [Adhaeribacter sp. BT258]|uniref:YceI family protein n=1 Tax=Adhaeribacter terrigena TaxID=2793070 RepID=A0ABS1BZ10_9BACT|nr:YceI family protein [Adhaeribacter terrigena]MBK0402362.1 YceI family protein [Adhaeribacter terrigena]